jgi:hypothetical protein
LPPGRRKRNAHDFEPDGLGWMTKYKPLAPASGISFRFPAGFIFSTAAFVSMTFLAIDSIPG